MREIIDNKSKSILRSVMFIMLCVIFDVSLHAQTPDSSDIQKATIYYSLQEASNHPNQVIRLDLSKQHLKSIPDGVFELKNLQELILSKNEISSLPSRIGELKNLRILDLSDNNLNTLPAEIGVLIQLRQLFLKRNKIAVLPAEMASLTALVELDLWGNRIIQLPMQMMALRPTLKTIDMRGINIKTEQRNAITEMLPETSVYFSGCNCN